jgi:regulatory protein
VGEAEARAAVDEAREEFDERELLAELLRRRFPDFIFRAAADRERRRVVNYFLRRGFSLPQVLSFFQAEER